jgi:hypothetical protein
MEETSLTITRLFEGIRDSILVLEDCDSTGMLTAHESEATVALAKALKGISWDISS